MSSKEKLLIPVLEAPSQCSLDAPSVLVNADRTNVEISVQVSIPPPEELNAMHSYLNRLYYWFLVGPIITLEWMRRTRRFCWHSRPHERHETLLDPEDESGYAERDIRSMEEGENRTVELGKASACQERLVEEQPPLTGASSESLDIRGRPLQGHPTRIFGKYLFGRRFDIYNFRNICCKISCLPASPRIFEHLKTTIIAHF